MSKLVTFEQAKMLESIGYSPKMRVLQEYDNNCSWTPLQTRKVENSSVEEALDWLREERHIPCYVDAGYCHQYDTVGYWGVILSDFGYIKRAQTEVSPTHPLAESALLTAVLEYLIEKEK